MLVPPTGLTKAPAGTRAAVGEGRPVDAELGVLVDVDLGDDGLDQHLRAADVELVDDVHDRAHELRRRGDDQRVVGADPPTPWRCARPPPAPRRRRRRRRPCGAGRARGRLRDAGHLLLELRGDLLGVRVVQVAHARVAAGLERGVQVRDQRADAQALRLLAADQHAVGALIGDHLDASRPRRPWRPGRAS